MSYYKQVSSPTSFPKSGQVSKIRSESASIKDLRLGSMYDAADVGSIPPSYRTIDCNQYAKEASERSRQGKGDEKNEIRTETYIYGTYLRSRWNSVKI